MKKGDDDETYFDMSKLMENKIEFEPNYDNFNMNVFTLQNMTSQKEI